MVQINMATAVRLGSLNANRIYAGAVRVWPNAYLNTAVGSVSTLDTPNLAITGKVRFSFAVRIDSLPAGFPLLINKVTGVAAEREFQVYTYAPNVVMALSTTNAAASANVDVNISQPMPLGAYHTFGIEMTPGQTATTTMVDGVRTNRVSGTALALPNGPAPLTIGYSALPARIQWAQMENLITPGIMWRFDPKEWPPGVTSFTDPRGRVWTLTNAAAIVHPA